MQIIVLITQELPGIYQNFDTSVDFQTMDALIVFNYFQESVDILSCDCFCLYLK